MYDGYRPLDPPALWIRLFDGREAAPEIAGDAFDATQGTEAERADAVAATGRPELPAAPDVPIG